VSLALVVAGEPNEDTGHEARSRSLPSRARTTTFAWCPKPDSPACSTIHVAFLAAPGEYDAWKEGLADRGVTLIDEIAWDSGVRSRPLGLRQGSTLSWVQPYSSVSQVRPEIVPPHTSSATLLTPLRRSGDVLRSQA
jgi:hypothetical protein